MCLNGLQEELGLTPNIQTAYSSRDQPNNALSLDVLEPGELATTAGTSAVIYGVTGRCTILNQGLILLHINNTPENPEMEFYYA